MKPRQAKSPCCCSAALQPYGRHQARLPYPSPTPKSTQTHVHWVGDAIQPSHPLLSPSPLAFNLSQVRVFTNESLLRIRWSKYWSFSFNISPSNEHSGLISFRMDWLDLLKVQGTLKIASQLKNINSLMFNLLYGPILTSIYDYWKNHSFDSMDLCWQRNVSAF